VIGSWLGWGAISSGHFDMRSIGLATLGAILLLVFGRMVRRL
jgi:hypothetical protein